MSAGAGLLKERCTHPEVLPVPADQTLGVQCWTCRELIAACWADEHIPESLWNRACAHPNDLGAIPSEQNREDVCAICKEPIECHGEAVRK